MKNTTFSILIAVCGLMFIASCNAAHENTDDVLTLKPIPGVGGPVDYPTIGIPDSVRVHKADSSVSKVHKGGFPVGKENFDALVTYIEKNGFLLKEKGISSDHQVTFFDTDGNRHALICLRRDSATDKPSKTGTPHISVWGYYKGIKDLEHFFGWYISSDEVMTFIFDEEYVSQHMPAVKKGYDEFLAKVIKKKEG